MILASKKNFAYGLLATILCEVSFGMNGFGAFHLRKIGFEAHAILFYRFGFAAVILATILLIRRESIRMAMRDFVTGVWGGLLFAGSALGLYLSFAVMDSGLACTLLFVYPVIVIAIMALFFHEKVTLATLATAVAAFAGIAIISGTPGAISLKGLLLVAFSALSYAGYMVLYERRKPQITAFQSTFLNVLVAMAAIFLHAVFTHIPIHPIQSAESLGYLLFLALVPTVISIFFTIESLKHLGSTLTSIFGAVEPLTASVVGILCLGEAFTLNSAIGSGIILSAITGLAFISKPKT